MAGRETVTIVNCGYNGCKEMAKVSDPNEAPEGWIQVQVTAHSDKWGHMYDRPNAFEFCSERCLEKWAIARRKAVAPAPSPAPAPPPARENTHDDEPDNEPGAVALPPKEERSRGWNSGDKAAVAAAFREQVLQALQVDPTAFVTADDVAGLVDMHSSTARKNLDKLADEGIVEVMHSKSQRGTPMRKYRLKRDHESD